MCSGGAELALFRQYRAIFRPEKVRPRDAIPSIRLRCGPRERAGLGPAGSFEESRCTLSFISIPPETPLA